MINKILTLLTVVLVAGTAFGQGTVRGVIKDKSNDAPIPFAKVKVEGVSAGANSDFDGEYELKLAAGNYTLVFSMSLDGFVDQKKEVTVVNDEVLVLNVDLSKDKAVQQLGEIKVVAQKVEGAKTVAADDARRRDEKGATEGVTDEQMKEKGVTTAIEAVQMAPGISVEDGKSVYVRGLGDRYTKTILNGMEIPGLDPDRNSVQMDIFPSAVIDNITVYKTFIPHLSGDFTGGLVDITTKDFPTDRTLYAKIGLGYNTAATFNKDYIGYKGGAIDFLGFDDGTRALPVRQTDQFPNVATQDPKLAKLTAQFNRTMAAEQMSNFFDQNYSFAYGDRLKKSGSKLTYGYNFVLNYRNTHRFYDDVQYSEYRLEWDDGRPLDELEKSRVSTGVQADNNIIWTALLGQSVKFKRSKIGLTLFHTQNGMSSTAMLEEENFEDNPAKMEKTTLQYTQRSISNANISGRHFLDTLGKWKLDWKISPTYSLIKDPDIRSTALVYTEDENGNRSYEFDQAVGAQIIRIWRELAEYNVGGRFDMTRTFKMKDDRKSELAFGASNTYKARSFEILRYLFDYRNIGNTELSNNPDWYFQDENLWTTDADTGVHISVPDAYEPANIFDARQNVVGAYVMNEHAFTKSFKATYGARLENAKNWFTGENSDGTRKYVDTLVLDEWNVLPSVNLVYKIEKPKDSVHLARYTNIRAAYATTVARPSFKEKSLAQIFDPLQGRTFNGNLDLDQTTIHNFDLRWEYFFGRTELISASAFYKRFIDPIEMVLYNAAPTNIQPLNSGDADVLGGEVEIRKAIGFNKPEKKHLSWMVGANFTYVYSRVNMNDTYITTGNITKTEKQIREENAREGEVIGDYRPLYGQSPYIVNAFTTFRNDSIGLTLNVTYNVQGKKLAVIGSGRYPDVFEQPFHSLTLKASKTLGAEQYWKVSLTAKNLLLNVRRRMYESHNATSQVYSSFNPGMQISASVSYSLQGKAKKDKKTKAKEAAEDKKL